MNTLYYGDNLHILRDYIGTETVDLIYLDPPFNSSRTYNVLFKDESGGEAEAQITAFEDTWHWNAATEAMYQALIMHGDINISKMISALTDFMGKNQMTAYLVMMAMRLVELYRVLKPTGSLYLHCDPTASHYLKIVLDTIFGTLNFQNEICWKRTSSHSGSKRWGPIHDIILFYSKTDEYCWNPVYQNYSEEYLETFYRFSDSKGRYRLGDLTGAGTRTGDSGKSWRGVEPTKTGRHWAVPNKTLEKLGINFKNLSVQEKLDILDREGLIYWPSKGKVPQFKRYLNEDIGVPIVDVITDINPIAAQAAERLGYPTQKPGALLERILSASSNTGDVVLDPFCGCGTTIAAAEKLGRQWIGIDITHLSIALQKYRLKDSFGLVEKKDYNVIGEPEDLSSAYQLKEDDPYQFQWWALSLIKARPLGGTGGKQGKKGKDRGIDGVITFIDELEGKPKQVLVQVKSGKVKSGDIRDLRGTIEREGAAMGVFITLENPSREMLSEAVAAGFYHSHGWNRDYPKLQIMNISELLDGGELKMPSATITFKQSDKIITENKGKQTSLF